uniref:BTB domain-containing protein n=1 Tax=Ascaris lumbricoides TaxID=6252 RepID=A0A9J2PIZ9_ASCLU
MKKEGRKHARSLRPRNPPAQRASYAAASYRQPPPQIGVAPPPVMHMPPPANLTNTTTTVPLPQVNLTATVNNVPAAVNVVVNEVPPEEPAHHMEVEEEKQHTEPTLSERMIALRENGVGFDVEFHVGPAQNSKILRAHRAVLAAGSKAFEKTFFELEQGIPPAKKRKLAAGDNAHLLVLEYPDVNPISFAAIIDFLYSDFEPESINVDDSVVLDTLYAARKFEVPQLENACIMLLGDIAPAVAVALLEQAKKHCSDELMRKCFDVIDSETDGALSSDSITKLNRETLKTIVERSELTPSDEIMIFRAVCAWADAECIRKGIEAATPQQKREILGDIFNAVRFPTMSVDEFGEVANSGMLTDQEIGILFRYLSSTVRPSLSLPFLTAERRCLGRSKHIVKRFLTLSKNPCKKMRSSIWFIVNREILVTALGVYGVIHANEANSEATEWETSVDIELACSEGNQNVKEHATVTLKAAYGDVRPLLARFKKPVLVVPNVPHRATLQFKEELETYAGANGAEDVRVHIGPGGSGAQESVSGGGDDSIASMADPATVVHFAFHNDDPNGIRRGMTRGPAVFTSAIGGFYNRPSYRPMPYISEGCLYEGQIPEIHFLAPALPKQEAIAAE